MGNRLFILLFSILVLPACKRQSLDSQNYISWVDNYKNGLIKTETIGKIKFTVAYRPLEYSVAKSILSEDTSNRFINQDVMHHSFIIKMEPVDGTTQILTIDATQNQEPFERINYYLNQAQNYIKLVDATDTLSVSNFHYERYYNLSPSQNLVVGFDQPRQLGSNDIKLIIEDKIFNTGKIAFNYSQSLLKDIPTLIKQ